MDKTRLGVKLNGFEYSALYHVQLSCIIPGLDYNKAPPLNTIIKGIIHYVYTDITRSAESKREFFSNAHMDQEIPEYSGFEPTSRIIRNSGSYIFLADETDIKEMNEINKLHIELYKLEYSYPQIIRFCIHYIFYGRGFFTREQHLPTSKSKFITYLLISNLYGIEPSIIIDILQDSVLNIRNLPPETLKKYASVSYIMGDTMIYQSARDLFIQSIEGNNVKFNLNLDFFRALTPVKYIAYDSAVKDFNFISVMLGLGLISHMWERDTFDLAFMSMQSWIFNKNETTGIALPGLTESWGYELMFFDQLFSRLLKVIKG